MAENDMTSPANTPAKRSREEDGSSVVDVGDDLAQFSRLGLGDEKDITLKGLEAVKKCSKVYMEACTSLLSFGLSPNGLSNLENLYGRSIAIADREMVEEKADEILMKLNLLTLNVDHTNDRGNANEKENRCPPLFDITNAFLPSNKEQNKGKGKLVNENRDKSGLSTITMFGMHTADGEKVNGYVVPTSSYQKCTPSIIYPIMSCGQISKSKPLTYNPKSLSVANLKNAFESCLSSNTKQNKGKGILVNENMDNSRLSITRMAGMHAPNGDKINGHCVAPTPSYQNCTPPVSIPVNSCRQVSLLKSLAYDPKSIPLGDLNNEFESCLSSNTKQIMGKGILMNEHMDSSRVNMQTDILSSSNVTPQDHSSQLNLESPDDDDDEDANECEEDDIDCWDICNEGGYREDIPFEGDGDETGGRKCVSMREYFAYKIQERNNKVLAILSSRRLFQQFLFDAYTMIESSRLRYIRLNQKKLRCHMYKSLQDAVLLGEINPSSQGKRIILPSSFTGGARYMIQNYQDAMAICKWAGYPDLFITFTCNPKWPEIRRFVERRGLNPEDRPDILARVFKIKLDHLIKDLRDNQIFGKVKAVIYTVEFQKRGLPHAHILLFLHERDKYPTAADIDRIIFAEIPDELADPVYYKAVHNFMIHGPCGSARKSSPCMQSGRCTKHFPKRFVESTKIDEEGYPVYRRRDNGRTIKKDGIDLDSRFVVPHNRFLLLKYCAHINVEWCNQSRSIKYLFKYINKGNDRVTAAFSNVQEEDSSNIDEINMYYDCRYISPCEATWRIFKFPIHHREPPVERLSFHLPNEQNVIFSDDDPIDDVANRPSVKESMFLSWFETNKTLAEARELTYAEFPLKFVWKKQLKRWEKRRTSQFSIGRIFFDPPGTGELYYLRLLLNVIKGPKSFDDLKRINNHNHLTFRDACYALGLLDDDKEYVDAIKEASNWGMPSYLRQLFAMLLLSNSMSRPEYVWQSTWQLLSEDILHEERVLLSNPEAELIDDELKNRCLQKLEKVLKSCGRSFHDFPTMPRPLYNEEEVDQANRLIHDELRYNRRSLLEEHQQLLMNLTIEQKSVYDKIMRAVNEAKGGFFFLYGYGGTGKTFIWKTLSSGIRSRGDIVLTVASSGIASLLLPGGRTAHSRFAIPLNLTEDSTCNIKQGSPLANLIIKTKLIIWDEAPMMHKYCFEALDQTLRDILRFKDTSTVDKPFGGKTVVLGGDFRQILPVIAKGSRQDIVNATLNSSYLWFHCEVLNLTKNTRLQRDQLDADLDELKNFSEWI
ncbi:putative diphthine methyl ester synthase [Nicotiana attenuata]|uniref:ATP-dependent DNA helicase n=1 Tax=Nicotiana attenuata TaxID=49451 RepID=A0A1J6KT21_NICAT|nr:putative diphthine methyl ester synthase [Nicotiana attenuata]